MMTVRSLSGQSVSKVASTICVSHPSAEAVARIEIDSGPCTATESVASQDTVAPAVGVSAPLLALHVTVYSRPDPASVTDAVSGGPGRITSVLESEIPPTRLQLFSVAESSDALSSVEDSVGSPSFDEHAVSQSIPAAIIPSASSPRGTLPRRAPSRPNDQRRRGS